MVFSEIYGENGAFDINYKINYHQFLADCKIFTIHTGIISAKFGAILSRIIWVINIFLFIYVDIHPFEIFTQK